jgi:hypothetical protein
MVDVDINKTKNTKNLISYINRFTSKEKLHILRILKNHNIDYSKNSYGYFFNLNNLNDEIFNKLWKCVDLIECNRDIIKQMDKKRDDMISHYTHLIETNLNKTKQEKLDLYINSLILSKIDTDIICNVKRKSINSNNNNNLDPDLLIKEYIKKLYKYPKNSVYNRILTIIKNSKSNKYIEKKEEDDDNLEKLSDYENENEPDLVIDNDVDIDNDIQDNDVEIEPENYENNDFENEDEEFIVVNEEEEILSEIHDNKSDILDEKDENEELIEDNNTKNEITYQYNLNFYRKLLNKEGYIFNENLKCLLVYQSYI